MPTVINTKKIKEFHIWANSKMTTQILPDNIQLIVRNKHSSSVLLDNIYAVMQERLTESPGYDMYRVKNWVYAYAYLLLVNRNSSSDLLLKVFTFLYGDEPLARGFSRNYSHNIYSKSIVPLLQHPNVTQEIVLRVYMVLKKTGLLGNGGIVELLSSRVLTTPDKIKIAEYFVSHPPNFSFLRKNWQGNIVTGLLSNRNPADLIQYTYDNYDISVYGIYFLRNKHLNTEICMVIYDLWQSNGGWNRSPVMGWMLLTHPSLGSVEKNNLLFPKNDDPSAFYNTVLLIKTCDSITNNQLLKLIDLNKFNPDIPRAIMFRKLIGKKVPTLALSVAVGRDASLLGISLRELNKLFGT